MPEQAFVRSSVDPRSRRQLQNRTGGVVSTTVTVWLHVAVWPQSSTALQVRVMTFGQVPLVTVLRTVTVTFPGPPVAGLGQGFTGVGGSKVQVEPHSTVLLVAQMSENPQPVAGGLTL